MNDNRNYKFTANSNIKRKEFEAIIKIIPPKSRVVDLGCGDGMLAKLLIGNGVDCEGVEISQSGVSSAKRKGVKVIKGRIDTRPPFKDKQFDYSVCNVTLQMVMFPEVLFDEMVRISRYQIVTFPNFAFFLNRIQLLLNGKMPTFMLFGYEWYSTGHIHQLSVRDFEDFLRNYKVRIVDKDFIYPKVRYGLFPNLFSTLGIYVTESL